MAGRPCSWQPKMAMNIFSRAVVGFWNPDSFPTIASPVWAWRPVLEGKEIWKVELPMTVGLGFTGEFYGKAQLLGFLCIIIINKPWRARLIYYQYV